METGDRGNGQGPRSDVLAVEEGGVVADKDPGGAVGSAGFVRGAVDDSGGHVSRERELADLGGEVEVLIGDVEGEDAAGSKVSAIEREGFGGEQVERDGVAGEGVDGEDIEVLRG